MNKGFLIGKGLGNGNGIGGIDWLYPYVPGEYGPNTMTRVGDWTVISNKRTSDYPVPQYSGEEFNIYSGDMQDAQTNAKQVIFGTRYLSPIGAYLKAWRVYVIAGNNYKLYSVEDPTGDKIINLQYEFTASENGWVDISTNPILILPDTEFDLIAIVQEPDPTPTVFSGDWNYSKPTNPTIPQTGGITHSNKELGSISVSYIDDNLADRTTELQSLTVGDVIRTPELDWAIQSTLDQGTYIEFNIAPSTQLLTTGVKTFEFETKVATPITYGIDNDYYISDPNISGLFANDDSYDNITVNDNAYGIDLLVQELVQSEDWDIVASSANLGGAGNKKESEFFEQVDVITEGDDKRIEFSNQVSVLGEFVVGEDSYPVELAFLAKESDTTGKTIINATNVTEILQSDGGSTTPMWGDNAVGDYIFIAAKKVYEGVKVKYVNLGTVEPDNIVPEFYKDDVDGWSNVSYMGTNSAPPYRSNADEISIHESEQVYFGFNPLLRDAPETWLKNTFTINGVSYVDYFWARFKIVAPITEIPILEQIKVHSDSTEIEDQGTFFKGKARTPIDLPYTIVKNDLKDPSNGKIVYTANVVADWLDNRLQASRDDGFLIIIRRPLNLDTSVPLVVSIAFDIEGNGTGDVVFDCEAIQVTDDFVYDGNGDFTQILQTYTIDQPSDNGRVTINFIVPVNKLKENSGVVFAVNRNASSDPLDTFNGSLNRSNVVCVGHKWKL